MSGLNCDKCGHSETKVSDTRPCAEGIRRRRTCCECNYRFTTYEIAAENMEEMKKSFRDKLVFRLKVKIRELVDEIEK